MGRFSRAIDASSLHPNRDEEYADGSGAGSRSDHGHAVGGWSATVQIENGLVGEGPPSPRHDSQERADRVQIGPIERLSN
jgi:hypothetical protein